MLFRSRMWWWRGSTFDINKRLTANCTSQSFTQFLNTQTGKLRYCTAGHPKFLWRHQSEATIDMIGDETL